MAEYFDVRATVDEPDVEDPRIQKCYDTINLMCFVYKDIPFKAMYEKPLRKLAREDLIPKIGTAYGLGLMPGAEKAFPDTDALVDRLDALSSEIRIYDLFTDPNLPTEITELLPAVRASGLCAPFVNPSSEDRARWRASLDILLGCDAQELSYYDVYTKSKNDCAPDVVSAIEQASKAGVLNKLPNHRVWIIDQCQSQPDGYCSTGLTGGPSLACTRSPESQ